MLTLETIASSSKGNCHLLKGVSESLLLDFGISLDKRLDIFSDNNIKGILLTHGHKDHIKGLVDRNLYYSTYFVYGNGETLDKCEIYNYQKKIIKEMTPFKIGEEFKVIAFEVPHDFKCYSYLIHHIPSNTNLLYMTDTGMAHHLTVKDVDYFLVECNYDEEWYNEIEENSTDFIKYKRLVGGKGHISLQQCCEFLNRNIGVNAKKVILSHISHSYDNYIEFEYKVRESVNNADIVVKALNNHIKKNETVTTILYDDSMDIRLEEI